MNDSERHAGRLFLKVGDIAKIQDNDPRTVRHSIEAGEIPAVRIGNTIRIPAERYWREVAQLGPESLRALGFTPECDPAGGADSEPDPHASGSGSDDPHQGSPRHGRTPPDPQSNVRRLTGL